MINYTLQSHLEFPYLLIKKLYKQYREKKSKELATSEYKKYIKNIKNKTAQEKININNQNEKNLNESRVIANYLIKQKKNYYDLSEKEKQDLKALVPQLLLAEKQAKELAARKA